MAGTNINADVSPTFKHGRKSSIGTGAGVQLVTAATPVEKGVSVKAAIANTGVLYVGNSSAVTANSADATDGYQLSAGDSVTVPVDDVSKIWITADAASQAAFWAAA